MGMTTHRYRIAIATVLVVVLVATSCATAKTSKKIPPATQSSSTLGNWQIVLKSKQYVYPVLSCPTVDRCVAGGMAPLYYPATNSGFPPVSVVSGVIATTQNGGKSWSTVHTSRPITVVTCMSKLRCIAIEQGYQSSNQTGWRTFLTTNGGVSWVKESSPGPVGANVLTCPSTTKCIAIGGIVDAPIPQTPTDRDTALAWTSSNGGASWVKGAYPGGVPNQLKPSMVVSISCPSPSWCMAITSGYPSNAPNDNGGSWISQNDGESWHLSATISGLGYALSCAAVDDCTVGGTAPGGKYPMWLTTTNGGLHWQERVIEYPSADFISSVDCIRVDFCVALVNILPPPPKPSVGVADKLIYIHGQSAQNVPIPSGLPVLGGYESSEESGISCPTDTRCYVEMAGNGSASGNTDPREWYILRSG